MTDHSVLSPSSAGIWGKPGGCPGSVTMQLIYSETEESETAAEGTAAHELAETMLNAYAHNCEPLVRNDVVGTPMSNGVEVTDDMFDGASMYAEHVIEIVRAHQSAGSVFATEQRVEIPMIHELMFGTADAHFYAPQHARLDVWDFKFGHEAVEAYENYQGISYVAGFLDHYNINGHADQTLDVYIHIVQPRAHHYDGPIRTWKIKASDLRGHFNIMKKNAADAMSPDAMTQTGRHCKNCTARIHCSAALRSAARFIEVAGEILPIEMNGQQLGSQLTIIRAGIERLKSIDDALTAEIEHRVKHGERVDGWEAIPTKGRLKWNDDVDFVALMTEHNVNLFKELQPLTPTQAKTEFKRSGVDASVISDYIHKSDTGLKLIAADPNRATKIFNK